MTEPSFVESAEGAARVGGAVLMRLFRNLDPREVDQKSRNDFVTRADRESEAAIRDYLSARHPSHAFLGEEGGFRPFSEGARPPEAVWIVDPLDGTANFLHGFPVFAVSVALKKGEELLAAAILDPTRDDLFTAERGAGARWNGRPARVSTKTDFGDAFLATGFPFRYRQHLDAYLALFKDIFLASRGIRRAGAAALDLAYVAAGVFDGFFELKLSPWDVAAGGLLIAEAGGVVTDFDGGSRWIDRGNVLAAAPGLHPDLLGIARRHLGEDALGVDRVWA